MSETTEIAQGRGEAQGPESATGRARATERDRSQWHGHGVAALALQLVVFLCPLSVAAFLGLLVSRSIPGDTVGAYVVRVVITALTSILAFMMVERLARRFLPLAALLRLNLVFPDRAPSRFSVALRSTSVRKLQQWVREARASDNVAVLAEKVVTLASALNTHDRRTRGHCERTRALADLIVEELRLSPTEANEVRWGAFLHDIGKLVVPAEILNKPGKPTTREWEVLKSHPEAGARLVEPLRPFLSSGVDAVGCHHENFDGTGYPAGLSGAELPLAARIVSVADAFEVMTAVRAYKRPMTLQAARAELARRSGTQFDPLVVRAFLNVSLGRVHWTLGIAAWVAELPFLTIIPRVLAQVSTAGGGGVIAPIALPGVAAASLGAIAVIGHVHSPPTRPSVASARTANLLGAAPSTKSPSSDPASTDAPRSTGHVTALSASASSVASPRLSALVPASRTTVARGLFDLTGPGSAAALSVGAPPQTDLLDAVGESVTSTVHAVAGPLGDARSNDTAGPSGTARSGDGADSGDTAGNDVGLAADALDDLRSGTGALTGVLPDGNATTTLP